MKHPNANVAAATSSAVLLFAALANRLVDAGFTMEETGLATTVVVYLVLRAGRRRRKAPRR